MKEINNLNDYFSFENTKITLNKENSSNLSPFLSEKQISTPKKIIDNISNINSFNKENPAKNFSINEKLNENSKTNILTTKEEIKSQMAEINSKINENLSLIENLKKSLNELKSEKNKKKLEIVNLLSNRESVDEIYKNYIEYFKSKNRSNKKNKNRAKKEIKNPFENQDEDAFEILVDEIKHIDLIKFIEQSFNLIEEIFDKPTKQLKLDLKEIINKSFTIFNNEINISNFIDSYSVVSNFFLRISIFLSNQSFGKYSETNINLFLRCLLKINSINVKNEELISYMNGKYKTEKNKLKEDINKLLLDNENLFTNKIFLEKKLKESVKSNNNNINYYFQTEVRVDENEKNINNIISKNNNGRKNNLMKKNLFKEKLKEVKKIYKEDLESKNEFDRFYFFTETNLSNSAKNYNYNEFMKYNELLSSTEKKNINNFEIEQRYSFKISDKQNESSNSSNKFNNFNLNDKYIISTNKNFEYTSPEVKNKQQSYYRNIQANNNNINQNISEYSLSKIISNEKKKNGENKKRLNFKYNNNKIITYNDIKKNMKFDLAKKIKYLDKVSKNAINTLSKTSIQSKKNKLIYEQEPKRKRMFTTEQKEKKVKYNFFDIIQETNKLRNSSGERHYQTKNKLFNINNINNNNLLLKSTKEKKINSRFDFSSNTFNINNKKFEHIVKSDFITNKKKSFFFIKESINNPQISSSSSKTKKNGGEKYDKMTNNSEISFTKNKINKNKAQNRKKILNGGSNNKKKKIEIINNKGNISEKNKIEKNMKINGNNKNLLKLSIKGNIKKGIKIKDIYSIMNDTKNKNSNNNILKTENFNLTEQMSKSNRSENIKHINYYTNSANKVKIRNINYNKLNQNLLLKRSFSSALSKLMNNKLKKNVIIDSFLETNKKVEVL